MIPDDERKAYGAVCAWIEAERKRTGREPNRETPVYQRLHARVLEVKAALYGDCPKCGGWVDSANGSCQAKCARDDGRRSATGAVKR